MTPLLERGTRISETLVADRLLGEGAFAEVYRVRHEFLGWQAMKLFKQATSARETHAMLGEARLLSTLGHPNIVRVFDASTVRTGDIRRGYFTMEYVAGGSLQRLLRTYRAGAVPIEVAMRALDQMSAALAVAHRQDPPILHRDLTPANVLAGYDGSGLRLRLSDFGLAKHVDPRTLLASAQGTYAYMAPEVLRGNGYSCAGDVWAWGTIAYLLLTNHFPYSQANEFEPRSLTRFTVPLLAPSDFNDDVGPELDRIVLAALRLDAADRPADAQVVHDELARCRAPSAAPPTRPGPAASLAAGVPAAAETPAEAPAEAAADGRAARLASEALALAERSSALAEAADLMEEAVSLSASLRERHLHRLTLWRRGVMM